MNRRLLSTLASMALMLIAAPAWSAGAEERVARDYLDAVARGNAEALLDFYHPDEMTALRARVMKVIEAEAMDGGNTVRGRIFGVVATPADARRLTPANLFVQLSARVGLPVERLDRVEVLGTVAENAQTSHVIVRLVPPEGARPHLTVITLLRNGKDWRVALPVAFQQQVDRLLSNSGEETKPAAPAQAAAANTADINALLDGAVDLLSSGKCSAYFNERMSPTFRANTSVQALRRLIANCERSVDTRETYIAALKVARQSPPRYEDSGNRAVYDMSGKGLPFQRFVLERIDRVWYIAE